MKVYNTTEPLSFKDHIRLVVEAAGFKPHSVGVGGGAPGGSLYSWRKASFFLEIRWSQDIRRILLVEGNGCSTFRAKNLLADRCFVPFDGEEAFWSYLRESLEKAR